MKPVLAILEYLLSLEAQCHLAERFHQENVLPGYEVEKPRGYIEEEKTGLNMKSIYDIR